MEISIELKGRYKSNPGAVKFFAAHARLLEKTMLKLSQKLKFKLPRIIVLRPFYWKGKITPCYGRVLWEHRDYDHFEVLLTYEHLIQIEDRGKDTLIHETCHIADMLTNRKMGHGKTWQKIYADYRPK